MFGFFRRCLVFGAPNPNKLLPEPGTRSPKPESEARTREARTRTYPEPGAAGCPKPEHIPQQDSGQRRFNPNKLTPAGTTRIKKPPPKRGQLGGNPKLRGFFLCSVIVHYFFTDDVDIHIYNTLWVI